MFRHWKAFVLAVTLLAMFALGVAAGSRTDAATAQQSAAAQPMAQAASDAGLVIVALDADGPAAEAGLKRGDILLKVDDLAVNNLSDLREALKDRKSGDEVTLALTHGDDARTLTATLAERSGRAYLGVQAAFGEMQFFVGGDDQPLPGAFSFSAGAIEFGGAIVTEVQSDSAAEKAGLKAGDRILALDDQAIDLEHDLATLIAQRKPGDTLTLKIARGGEDDRAVKVTLGANPDDKGKAYLGVRYDAFRPFPAQNAGGPPGAGARLFNRELPFKALPFDFGGVNQSGAIVGQVEADSAAEKAGLKEGDLITAIDDQPVGDPKVLIEAIAAKKPGDTIKLSISHRGDKAAATLEVALGEKDGKAYLGVNVMGFVGVRTFDGTVPDGMLLPEIPMPGFDLNWPELPTLPDTEPIGNGVL
ncbi:MAG: PDZ domain-containing protein [Chloroflexi bacterium]|nr:PDZ domain-containing protein [Chloroflexota bacterium]